MTEKYLWFYFIINSSIHSFTSSWPPGRLWYFIQGKMPLRVESQNGWRSPVTFWENTLRIPSANFPAWRFKIIMLSAAQREWLIIKSYGRQFVRPRARNVESSESQALAVVINFLLATFFLTEDQKSEKTQCRSKEIILHQADAQNGKCYGRTGQLYFVRGWRHDLSNQFFSFGDADHICRTKKSRKALELFAKKISARGHQTIIT